MNSVHPTLPAPKPAKALPRIISATEFALSAAMYVTFPPMAIMIEPMRTILICRSFFTSRLATG